MARAGIAKASFDEVRGMVLLGSKRCAAASAREPVFEISAIIYDILYLLPDSGKNR